MFFVSLSGLLNMKGQILLTKAVIWFHWDVVSVWFEKIRTMVKIWSLIWNWFVQIVLVTLHKSPKPNHDMQTKWTTKIYQEIILAEKFNW